MSKTKSLILGSIIGILHIVSLIITIYAPDIFVDYILLFILPFAMALYTIKGNYVHSFIVAGSTLLISVFIDLTLFRGILLLLPILATGLLMAFFIKKKFDAYTTIYGSFILEVGLFFGTAGLCSLFTQNEYIICVKEIFKLHAQIDTALYSVILLVLFCFLQVASSYFIMRFLLTKKKISFEKAKYPPFWLLILGVGTLIASFIPYKDKELYTLLTILAVIFAAAIAIYGYQAISKKITVMFIVQAAFFVIISIPLIASNACKETVAIPYIIFFIPPFVYGVYDLFLYAYAGEKKLEA